MLSPARHHDPPGHLSHATLRRSLRESQHFRSVAVGGKVLHAAAGDDCAGAHAERFAAAILGRGWPMTVITTSDGVKLHVEEAGEGTPILFIHEFGGNH